MTTLSRPATRPRSSTGLPGPLGQDRPPSETVPSGPQAGAGLDSDSVYSYALDGFTPASVDKSGSGDPQDSIDLEGLAEQVYRLLLREAYFERERRGPQR